MSHVVLEDGRLRQAIVESVGKRDEGKLAVERPGSDDLFSRALGHRAIVYGPAPSLLDGKLDPSPSAARIRGVLRAANAPGVSVVVVVLPEGDGYASELDVLRRDGKPYLVIAAPPLLEEVGDVIASGAPHTLWLPSGGLLRTARVAEVAHAVAEALGAEEQGRIVEVLGEVSPAPTVFRRAAEIGANHVRVRHMTPWLHRLLRPVIRWWYGREPPALALLDRLFPRPATVAALSAASDGG
jgi:hypothetical protein